MQNTQEEHKTPTPPTPFRRKDPGETALETPIPGEETVVWSGNEAWPGPQEAGYPTPTGTMPEQDRITTPMPRMAAVPTTWVEPVPPRSGAGLSWIVALCFILSLASLAVSAFMVYSFWDTRQTAVEGLDAAIAALDNLGGKGFHYEYHFQRNIPVSTSIPIQQDMVFPFKGTIPINTTVRVPINAGVLGTIVVDVPIRTSVSVDTKIPVHVDQTFQISTTIPISMTFPIDVQPGDPEIQKLLGGVREWLVRLRDSFH